MCGVSSVVMKVCNVRGCPELVPTGSGRCPEHQRRAEARRGSPARRGYGREHRRRFREGVLAKNPICVLCMRRTATDADHYPHSRDELIELGLDPNDPQYGRGLCAPCHSSETARNQPGGWAAERRF